MHTPNGDSHRASNRDLNRYDTRRPDAGATTRGGLTGLLALVVLMGGLVAFSMLRPSLIGQSAPSADDTAPQSVIDGAASGQTPATPVE
ncbi:hypothetical protein [Roseovarius sp.]|uniref:hypothetical protein n=1 Tax=Roseovarius sp. TaxID=1486281 RepID=UPI003A974948